MFVVGVIVNQATRFIPILIISIVHELSNLRRITFTGPNTQEPFAAILPQSAGQRDAAKQAMLSWLVVWIQPR